MIKKIVSSVLAVLLIVSIFTIVPFTASAEEEQIYEDYTFVVTTDESGEEPVEYAEITGYTGEDAEVVIPETLGGLSVKAIRREAFRRNGTISFVDIPDSVTFIADYAFADCENLSSVELPAKLDDLGRASFYNCTALETISLPNTITKCYANSGVWATFRGPFNGCTSLSTIEFEDGVTTIPDYLFEGCTGITAMDIPDTVTSIGSNAFANCTNMTAVDIPDTAVTIGDNAFIGCTALTKISLPEGLTTVESNTFDSCSQLEEVEFPTTLTTINDYAFQRCNALKSVTLPANLTTLDQAFYECENLESVNIPKSLAAQGSSVYKPFASCSSLDNITFENGITAIPAYLFANCSGLTSITIPATASSIGEDAFYKCANLETVTLHDNITAIGENAFYNCGLLSGVTLPKNLATLGESAFGKCTSIESIEIPKSLTSAGTSVYGPFYDCSNLKTVTFEAGATAIPARLFGRCTGIEEINIPEGITSIGEKAFYGYSVRMQLRTVTLPSTLESIGSEAFQSCGALEEVTIPASVTDFGNYAFWGCSGLAKVTIENGVTAIGDDAFRECSALTTVSLPESLTKIGDCAFWACGIESVKLPSNLTHLGATAFYQCPSLKSINIPKSLGEEGSYCHWPFRECPNLSNVTIENGMKTIPETMFEGCTGLTEIDIPASVTSIGKYAFEDCSSLQSVEIPEAVTSIGGSAFYGCESLENVKIPDGVTELNSYTFAKCYSLNTFEVGTGITKLDYCVFNECCPMTFILKADDIETIASNAFGDMYSDTAFYAKHSATNFRSYVVDTLDCTFYGMDKHNSEVWSWSDDYSSATLDINCDCGIGEQSVEAEVTSKPTKDSTCTEEGEREFTATAEIEGRTYTDTKIKKVAAAGHSYGEPEWTWDGFDSASAEFTCSKCKDKHTENADITSEVTTEAKCTASGVRTYTAKVILEGKTYTTTKTQIIPPKGHSYGEPEWTWDGLNSSSASFKCTRCDDVKTKDAVITSEVTKEPTGDEDGVRIYTAKVTFNLKDYTDTKTETIPAKAHVYGEPEWKWNGYTSADAVFSCTECDDVQTREAVITSKVTTAATCDKNGARTYTAKAIFDGKEYTGTKVEVIPKTGHSYGAAKWKWSGYTSAIAEFTCSVCGKVTKVDAKITSKVTKEATTSATGVRTYTAKVTFEGKSYTGKKTETIPKVLKTTISVKAAKTSIEYGSTTTVTATVKNGKGSTTFSSGDKSIATVNSSGKVTAKKVGTVYITAKNNGVSAKVKITVTKKANPMTVTTKHITVSFSKANSVTNRSAITVKSAKGKVTYKKKGGNANITVNSKTGNITVKKATKKGNYKIAVDVTAAGDSNHKSLTRTVSFTVTVK